MVLVIVKAPIGHKPLAEARVLQETELCDDPQLLGALVTE